MATALISDLRDPVRALLGDHAEAGKGQMFTDQAIDRGASSAIRFGMINGDAVTYTTDGTNISPAIDDPNLYARLSAEVALMFVAAEPSRRSLRLRGFSESVGHFDRLRDRLEMWVRKLKNGPMFSSWRSYSLWSSRTNPEAMEWWERWRAGDGVWEP